MKRVKVFAALLLVAGLVMAPERAVAQAEIGAQLDLFSSYVWRGLSLTNKPVLQPDVWVSFPAGNASITVGGWSSIDLGRYDDLEDDISESGAISSFNLCRIRSLCGGRVSRSGRHAHVRRHRVHLSQRRRFTRRLRTASAC